MGVVVEGEGEEGGEVGGEVVRLRDSPARKLGCTIGRRAKQRRSRKKRMRCEQQCIYVMIDYLVIPLKHVLPVHVHVCVIYIHGRCLHIKCVPCNMYCLCSLPQRAVVSISREAEANITRILHDVRCESQTASPSGASSSWQEPSGSWQESHQLNTASSSNTVPSLLWGSESSQGGCGLTAGQVATCSMTSHLGPGDTEAVHRLGQVYPHSSIPTPLYQYVTAG